MLLGVFCYNMAKYRENQAKDKLPTSFQKPVTSKPLWENHYTFDSKVMIFSYHDVILFFVMTSPQNG